MALTSFGPEDGNALRAILLPTTLPENTCITQVSFLVLRQGKFLHLSRNQRLTLHALSGGGFT